MPTKLEMYTVYSYAENNPQGGLIWPDTMNEAWPEFMKHDQTALEYLPELRVSFPETVCIFA